MEYLTKLVYDNFISFIKTYKGISQDIRVEKKELDDNLKSKYIVDHIFTYSKTHLNDVCIVSTKVFNIDVNVYIYHDSKLHPKYLIEFLVFYTMLLVHILHKIKPQEKQLDIYLLLTPFEKQFPDIAESILTPANINSGVTTRYMHDDRLAEVTVFREEEICKVLLHELIHALQIDCGCTNMEETPLKELFGFPKDMNIKLNESYTDFLACFINLCIYSSFHTYLLIGTYNTYKTMVKKLLEYESIYILCKSYHILSHYGFTITNNDIKVPKGGYTEKTHVFSYYIIKALLFCHTKEVLKHMSETHYILKDTHLQTYAEYIVNLYNKHVYTKKILDIMGKEIIPMNMRKSLRMSNVDMINILKNQKDKLLKTLQR